jgi:hypothetical protein
LVADLSRVGILLHGGSFPRADQVGFFKAIDEDKRVKIACIDCVSVGALNGAGYLQYGSRGLELIWRGPDNPKTEISKYKQSIDGRGPSFIFPIFDFKTIARVILRKSFVFDNSGLQELVRGIDVKKIVSAPIPLRVIAYNEFMQQPEIFSTHDELLQQKPEIFSEIMLAAISPDGVFPPVWNEARGAFYSDAMTYGVKQLFDFGCTTVFVFRSRASTHRPFKRGWWLSKILALHDRASNILFDQVLIVVNKLYPGRVIEFRLDVGVSTLSQISFRKGDIRKTIDLAYQKGKSILAQI